MDGAHVGNSAILHPSRVYATAELHYLSNTNQKTGLSFWRVAFISEGRKDWWVRLKTLEGKIGWSKAEDQFDCIDSLGGDEKCDKL